MMGICKGVATSMCAVDPNHGKIWEYIVPANNLKQVQCNIITNCLQHSGYHWGSKIWGLMI